MSDLRLDPRTGDLDLSPAPVRTLRMVDGADAVAQRCRIALGTPRGAYALNIEFGIDYRRDVLVHHPDAARIGVLVRELLAVRGGVDIVEFVDVALDRALRRALVRARLRTHERRVIDLSIPLG